ncbi:MAG: YicC/YloC family endoribonuclease [Balneolaceae bacterium]
MIKSMTGFGRGEYASNGFQITVELKTLNSRYLDISIRTPKSLQDHELDIKEMIQKKLSRGKVHININVEMKNDNHTQIAFNSEKVKAYGLMLNEVRTLANIKEPVTIRDILRFEEIFETKQPDEELVNELWNYTGLAMDDAIKMLNTMREQEGKELKKDLLNQIKGISEMILEVTQISEARVPGVREKLQTRIKSMISEDKIDPERMEMEIALLVDKMDVNEEIIRLQSHLKFFLEALESDVPVGRRINFLCQEINRELNTIGSKANDSVISQHIVLGKEKLEQVREQVQNIE